MKKRLAGVVLQRRQHLFFLIFLVTFFIKEKSDNKKTACVARPDEPFGRAQQNKFFVEFKGINCSLDLLWFFLASRQERTIIFKYYIVTFFIREKSNAELKVSELAFQYLHEVLLRNGDSFQIYAAFSLRNV